MLNIVWWTKKSRIQAEKRLRFNDFSSQLILLWYSAFALCVSIFELKEPSSNSDFAMIMVVLSVLIFSASMFIGNRNFKERAVSLKHCYEQLTEIEAQLKDKSSDVQQVMHEYSVVLGNSENHDDIDFKQALISEWLSTHKKDRWSLSRTPTAWDVLEVLLFISLKFSFITLIALLPLATFALR